MSNFVVPTDVLRKLGNGDNALGLACLRDALGGHHIKAGQLVSADVLSEIGRGDARAGRRVWQKFIATVRRQRVTKTRAA